MGRCPCSGSKQVIVARRNSQFDVIVLGGGSAGIAAAESARAHGAHVAIVEAAQLGGECPNWACVPTKALLRAATLYNEIRTEASDFGISTGPVRFRFGALMARKSRVVRTVTGEGKRLQQWADREGIAVLYGKAKFIDAHTVQVGKAVFSAASFVLATGSEEYIPPIAGIDEVPYLTSRSVTALQELPKSVAVVGGGAVGCELATFFALLGVKTYVFEASPHILGRIDPDVAEVAAASLRGHGAHVVTDTRVLSVTKRGKAVTVVYQHGKRRRQKLVVDAIVMAAGKRPRLSDLGLEAIGVAFNDGGYLALDTYQRTKVKHILAAGDVTGVDQFTHTAHAEGRRAGRIAAVGIRGEPKYAYTVVPHVLFVEPEVATVGLTEQQARAAGYGIGVGTFPVGALSRAVIDGKRDGLLKVVVDEDSGLVLGAHMVGERAGEVLHELALAIHARIPFSEVAAMLHAFPCYSEVIPAVAAYLE